LLGFGGARVGAESSEVPKDSERDTFSLCADTIDELREASPRAKAIVAASALDEILARLLEREVSDPKIAKRLVRRPYAPLGTFSARIDAAFGFRLIGRIQYEALGHIRSVRNHFAHVVNCSFSDEEVLNHCRDLDIPGVIYPPDREEDPEIRYLMNASALCGQLDGAYRIWVQNGIHPSSYRRGE
jgi:hypothetical protein